MIFAKKISIEMSERIGKQVTVSRIHNELKYIGFISAVSRKYHSPDQKI